MMEYKLWFEEFGFRANPFSIRPQDSLKEFIGQKEILKSINKEIRKKSVIILKGIYGTGKTTILQGIIEKFKGKRRVIYYNRNADEKAIDFGQLIKKAGSLTDRLFGEPKDLILLLDEAHNCGVSDFENLEQMFNEKIFKAVVLVTADSKKMKVPQSMKKKATVFTLKPLDQDSAYALVRKRMGKNRLIAKKDVGEILKLGNHPREFLMNCEDVCRNAYGRGAKKVGRIDIETLANRKAAKA